MKLKVMIEFDLAVRNFTEQEVREIAKKQLCMYASISYKFGDRSIHTNGYKVQVMEEHEEEGE